MGELYWITRFDGFLTAVIIILIIFLLLSFIFFVGYCNVCDGDERKALRKRSIVCGIVGLALLILQAFIPTTKDALIIYGVGSTIDYLKNNDKAKQLPDKAIIALDKYLESFNEVETKQ